MNDSLLKIKSFFNDLGKAYWTLIRLMVPALIVVKILEEMGATEFIAILLEPLMLCVGLPSELGLVWAASMLTNIYTAMVVFYELGQGHAYSVAEITILGSLILFAHALPVEGAVAKATGVSWKLTLSLRVGGGFLFGMLTYAGFALFNLGDAPAQVVWQPDAKPDPSLVEWFLDQLKLLAMIFLILMSLMAAMRLLRWLGVEKLFHWLLSPLMKALRIGRNASDVTIIGLLLGLSFGAGLLISEARSGRIPARDMAIVICFLGLCHSIVEDTLLIMFLGAEWTVILFGRLIFSVCLMAAIVPFLFKPEPVAKPE